MPENKNTSSWPNTTGDQFCQKCGKPFCYVGDVPEGGFEKGMAPYCECGVSKITITQPISQPKSETELQTGWICPKCGKGVSPSVTVCPCSEE